MSTTIRKKSRQPQHSRRKVLRRQSATAPFPIASDADAPIWGAKAIGVVIGKSERAAYHLLESKAIKGAKKIRGTWSAIPSVLRAQWESMDEAGGAS